MQLGLWLPHSLPHCAQVLAGSAGFLLPSLAVGAVGGVCALANFAAEECARVYALWAAGKLDEARALQGRLIPVNAAVTGASGVALLKAAMELKGFKAGFVRAPLLEVDSARKAALRNLLLDARILDATPAPAPAPKPSSD